MGIGWGDGIGRFGGVCGPILGGLLLGNQLSGSATLMVFACILIVSAIIIFFSTDYTKDAQNRYKTEYGLCQRAKYDLKQRNQVFDFAALS
jgi:hypothetical protein